VDAATRAANQTSRSEFEKESSEKDFRCCSWCIGATAADGRAAISSGFWGTFCLYILNIWRTGSDPIASSDRLHSLILGQMVARKNMLVHSRGLFALRDGKTPDRWMDGAVKLLLYSLYISISMSLPPSTRLTSTAAAKRSSTARVRYPMPHPFGT
jgi:hypothetical protein